MATRKGGDGGSDKGRVKVRVIEFEMDGSNQTLRDSIRDIVGAIGRGPAAMRQANAQVITDESAGSPDSAEAAAADGDAAFEGDGDSDGGSSPRRPRAAPRTPVVLDIDLRSGKMPLPEFLTKLNLDTDTDKYAAIAHWLRTISSSAITEISADHIHTGFRAMKWSTPTDAAAPLRALKGRSYGYMKSGSKPGTFVLNHVGDNHVMDLMKKAGIDL